MFEGRLVVSILIEGEDALGVDGCCSSPTADSSLNTLGQQGIVFGRGRLRDGIKLRVFLLVAARAASAMVATAAVLMALDCGLQVRALEHLLTTVAFGVSRARFAHRAAVLALRYWPPLLVDVLKWTVGMLTIADTMPSHAGIASIFLAVDKHGSPKLSSFPFQQYGSAIEGGEDDWEGLKARPF